jgi:sec-independent protein translocase protein TatC
VASTQPPRGPGGDPESSPELFGEPGQYADGRMPFMEHLGELRTRLIRSLIAVAAGCGIAYLISNHLFAIITQPLREVGHGKLMLIGTGVGEAFFTELKVSLIAGLFLASPVVFYQIWKFVAPGLYDTERRLALPFVASATFFFVLGAYFCWAVVFKLGFRFFLAQYANIGVTPTLRISEYLGFASKLLLAFGITFEMPIFAFFLTRVGVVDYRLLIGYFRYAVLIIFIVAALLTPPDVFSMILLAIPLMGLYGLSILVAYFARTIAGPGTAAATPEP